MDRRNLLKTACGMGLCSCAAISFFERDSLAAETTEDVEDIKRKLSRLQWWSNHFKKQNAALWKRLQSELDKNTIEDILESQGRSCAQSIDWAQKHKGDPDGFFKLMRDRANEQIDYDKDAGIITVQGPERDNCYCEMVDTGTMPSCFCHCSVGWQKQTYETILGKPVDVQIVESVLKGNKRCAFKITVKQ